MFFINLFSIKQLIIIMEEDILNYSPIVMFRGTPCMFVAWHKTKLQIVLNSYSVQLGKAELGMDWCRRGESRRTPCRDRKECDRPSWTPDRTSRHQVKNQRSFMEIHLLQVDVLLHKI